MAGPRWWWGDWIDNLDNWPSLRVACEVGAGHIRLSCESFWSPGCGEGNVKLLFCAGWVAALTHEASIQQVRGGCRAYSSFESILSTKICRGDRVQLATVGLTYLLFGQAGHRNLGTGRKGELVSRREYGSNGGGCPRPCPATSYGSHMHSNTK